MGAIFFLGSSRRSRFGWQIYPLRAMYWRLGLVGLPASGTRDAGDNALMMHATMWWLRNRPAERFPQFVHNSGALSALWTNCGDAAILSNSPRQGETWPWPCSNDLI